MEFVSLSLFVARTLYDRVTDALDGSYPSQLFCRNWRPFYDYASQQAELPELLPQGDRQSLGIRVSAAIHDEICQLATQHQSNKSVVMRNCFQYICDKLDPPTPTPTPTATTDPLLTVIGEYLLRPDRDKFADDVIQIVTASDRETLAQAKVDREKVATGNVHALPQAVVPSKKGLVEFIDRQGSVSVDDIRKHFWQGQFESSGVAGGLVSRLNWLAEGGQLSRVEVDGVQLYSVVHEPQTDEDNIIRVITKGGWVNAEYLIRNLYLDQADDELKQLVLGRVYNLTAKGLLKARVKSDNKIQWALTNGQGV